MGLLMYLKLRRPNKWERPTLLDWMLSSPLAWLMSHIYHLLLFLRGSPLPSPSVPPHPSSPPRVRIVCLSDTHDQMPAFPIPAGDLLIHCGDLTNAGTAADVQRQIDWLAGLPHPHKVLVCGNHDSWFDPRSRSEEDKRIGARAVTIPEDGAMHYLERSGVQLEFHQGRRKLYVWGAPDLPECGPKEFAFQYPRDAPPWKGLIPMETDILVTHTPPAHHLDLSLGCPSLLAEVYRVRPRVHVFGHVHWGCGRESVWFDACQRSYESLMARATGSAAHRRWGFLADLVPGGGGGWMDALRMLYFGAEAVLWKWLMLGPGGGKEKGGGVMVNAAVMRGNTGKLGKRVQVIDI